MKKKILDIVISLLFIVLGAFLVISPGNTLSVLSKILSILLMLVGISLVIKASKKKDKIEIGLSVLVFLLAFVVLFMDDNIGDMFSLVLGSVMFLISVNYFKKFAENKVKEIHLIYSTSVMVIMSCFLLFSNYVQVLSFDNMRGGLILIFGLNYLGNVLSYDNKKTFAVIKKED